LIFRNDTPTGFHNNIILRRSVVGRFVHIDERVKHYYNITSIMEGYRYGCQINNDFIAFVLTINLFVFAELSGTIIFHAAAIPLRYIKINSCFRS